MRRTGWKVNPAHYDEIVVYNDWTPFGRWLQDCKACYVLGEDTRNHLDHPNQYIDRRILPGGSGKGRTTFIGALTGACRPWR